MARDDFEQYARRTGAKFLCWTDYIARRRNRRADDRADARQAARDPGPELITDRANRRHRAVGVRIAFGTSCLSRLTKPESARQQP